MKRRYNPFDDEPDASTGDYIVFGACLAGIVALLVLYVLGVR